jgi:YVTN family beta-propeller protein
LPELPSGTVTFLFTDIEGSTRLLARLRERYGDLLADHHRLLRAAFDGSGGQEIGTQGDSFFVAFRRAKDAISGAVAAQRSLAAHAWPDGLDVRVRMGIHTGEPSLSEVGLVSLAVHRAARISAAGHGGQVLLSSTTRDLVEDELPDDVRLRDLGEHRLKDLDRPERIHELVIEGLRDEFPPLKTLESQPTREIELAELAGAAQAARARLSRRRALLVAGLVAVLAVAVAVVALVLSGGDDARLADVEGNAVGVIDPETNRLVGEVPVGRPGDVTFGSGALWVANLDDRTISRIDPATQRVERVIPTGDAPRGLAAGRDTIWFTSARPDREFIAVRRIAPRFDVVDAEEIKVRGVSFDAPSGGGVAAGPDGLWVAPQGLGGVSRIDPASGTIVAEIDAGNAPTSVALGVGAAWVVDSLANAVTRIDPTNVVTATIPVGRSPSGIAVGAGAVWVAATLDDVVVRIDPSTNAVRTTIAVGRSPVGIAVGAGGVWVTNSREGTVSRIDPQQDRVVATIRVGGRPQGITVAGGRVWVGVQEAAAGTGREVAASGGSARLNAQSDVDSLDPALARSALALQLEYATCAKLLNYPDRPAPAGSQPVPEVAQAMPVLSADRRRYTFTIRKGFRFSPPSNEPVTAKTFKYVIERTLHPRMRSPVRSFGSEIVGVKAFEAGRAAHLAGVLARGNTLTIQLTEPVPDLTTRLADPAFCAVPTDTPIDPSGVRAPASAGPYYVASRTPGQEVVLERNPNYAGDRSHSLDEIAIRVGIGRAETVAQIESGTADYALDGTPVTEHARLAARYGAGSAAAKAGKQQYFVNPLLQVAALELNESRQLFADVRVRKAVNHAIDRRALARPVGPLGEIEAEPTDQYLPPGMPGFRDADIYPLTPDVATARRLMGGRRRNAVLYVCDLAPCPQVAQIVTTNLKAIGIDVEVKAFSLGAYVERLQRAGEPFDMALILQEADSPDPGRFLGSLFARKSLYRGASSVDSPAFRRKLDAAGRQYGARRYLAYAELDADLARNAAPIAAFGSDTRYDFFSARMGCQIYHPVYGMNLAALCVRR